MNDTKHGTVYIREIGTCTLYIVIGSNEKLFSKATINYEIKSFDFASKPHPTKLYTIQLASG